jgi:hypothetical protein
MSKLRLVFSWSVIFLLWAGMKMPVQAQEIPSTPVSPQHTTPILPQINVNVDHTCFALSNEPSGNLISHLVEAGFGNNNLYETLVALSLNTDPSISGVLTDAFMNSLAGNPLTSENRNALLKSVNTPGSTVEICSDGSFETYPISGFGSAARGFPSLTTNISGVENANITHTTANSGDIATWVVAGPLAGMTTTYHVFGVAWGVGHPPLLYLPLVVR